MQNSDLIVTIAILLAAALAGGMIAHRLRQPVILGYMVLGIAVGPHALGLVSDMDLVESFATIGVTLLMLTLGLEISITQLREVGRLGTWGGIAQIGITLSLGLIAGLWLFNWQLPQSILFGLIISLSSTAVCSKILMERGEVVSVHGRIMLAFLIFQDIGVIAMMVVLPLLGGSPDGFFITLLTAFGKGVLFIGLAIVLGRWGLPWLLGRVGGVQARELFLLTVLVLCLGAAIGTEIFGLSIVFGAFLVGLVMHETRFVHQAMAAITPLRDIFATLFFVSLGMLLDPAFVMENWQLVLVMVGIITLIKLTTIYGVVRVFGYSSRIALLTGGGLFQIGEFGFILAQLGIDMGIVSGQFYSLIISSAIITMLLTPLPISLISRYYPKFSSATGNWHPAKETPVSDTPAAAEMPNRIVIAGYGAVGQHIALGLQEAKIPFLVIEMDPLLVSAARSQGRPRLYGDATNIHVLEQANLGKAGALVITFPDPMAVITTAKVALQLNPNLKILARVHHNREAQNLKNLGVTELIDPEYEASFRFTKRLFNIVGLDKDTRKHMLAAMRHHSD